MKTWSLDAEGGTCFFTEGDGLWSRGLIHQVCLYPIVLHYTPGIQGVAVASSRQESRHFPEVMTSFPLLGD